MVLTLFVGIMFGHYDSMYKSHHQLCLSILKEFGFGQRVMETSILIEVEEMISKVREMQGRPFDIRQLTTSCVANVILSVLFGRRFDHSDPAFRQLVLDVNEVAESCLQALQLFPALRFLPHFKKMLSKLMRSHNSIAGFTNNNIAACTRVGNSRPNTIDVNLTKYSEIFSRNIWATVPRTAKDRVGSGHSVDQIPSFLTVIPSVCSLYVGRSLVLRFG